MFKLLGVKNFFTNIDLLSRVKMPLIYRTFMKEITTAVHRDALQRTPIDTGLLRASSRKAVKGDETGSFGEVSYHADYSIPVHENLTARHPIGEAKYLENAVRFIVPLFPRMLQHRIKTALNRRAMRDIRIDKNAN